MLKLYAIPESLYCAKLRILLRHKGLSWEEVPPPGGYGSDEYKQTVPSGNLPALDHDGVVIADSEAIAEYLNEIYPNPPMLPADPVDRARCRELSRFHDTRLEPELRKLFPFLEGNDCPSGLLKDQGTAISRRLSHLSVILQQTPAPPYRTITLADCGFPISFCWMDIMTAYMGLELDWPTTVQEWRQETEAFEAVEAELTDYRPRLQEWLFEETDG